MEGPLAGLCLTAKGHRDGTLRAPWRSSARNMRRRCQSLHVRIQYGVPAVSASSSNHIHQSGKINDNNHVMYAHCGVCLVIAPPCVVDQRILIE